MTPDLISLFISSLTVQQAGLPHVHGRKGNELMAGDNF